jgi:uncharacterized protein YjiS (DUF1127 family)
MREASKSFRPASAASLTLESLFFISHQPGVARFARQSCVLEPDRSLAISLFVVTWNEALRESPPEVLGDRSKVISISKGTIMFDTVVSKYKTYRRYQETYRELSRLTTRELDDLGIARGEIPALARRAAI